MQCTHFVSPSQVKCLILIQLTSILEQQNSAEMLKAGGKAKKKKKVAGAWCCVVCEC